MAVVNGKQSGSGFAVLLVDGYSLLASKVKGFGWKKSVPLEDSTGLGDTWTESAPTGLQTLTVTQQAGFFDTATHAIHDAFSAMALTVRTLCLAPATNEIGAPFIGVQGAYSQSYDAAPAVGALTKASASYGLAGQLDEGQIVQSHTTKTIDWNTATDGTVSDYTLDASQTVIPITSASKAVQCVVTTTQPHGLSTGQMVQVSGIDLAGPVINGLDYSITVISPTTFSFNENTTGCTGTGAGGSLIKANSLNGGVGYQSVSALTGLTGFVGKIRDSADNVTYADLITFANVTAAPAAERLTVSGTVDRYLSFDGNVTGTGSLKPFVGFKRNA
jgi:hypothetical protein